LADVQHAFCGSVIQESPDAVVGSRDC